MVERAGVSAREETLARIRAALGHSPEVPTVPRNYRRAGSATAESRALIERFSERVTAYKATVIQASPEDLEMRIAAACSSRGRRRLIAAPGAPWEVPGVEVIRDGPAVDIATLDAADGALTGCALAVAETGTIALDGGSLCGRRALTLVPDYHICVVAADQLLADLPDAIAALSDAARAGRPLTLVSGPSATSDIELERVEGVHGPRQLDVVVILAG
jgi:L-lactate dehydrogenase complex protein LldG